MRLTCPHCQSPLNLPDDKVPEGRRFKLACPKCTEPFIVDPENMTTKTEVSPPEPDSPVQTGELEFYPPGAKVAFLFVRDPDWVAGLMHCLKQREYHVALAGNQAEALRRIDAVAYQLIFIEQTPEAFDVLRRVHAWAGIQRRSVNVILIGHEFKSLHPQAAFRHGVNGYFHHADRQNTPMLVQSAIAGYDEFYKVWRLAAQTLSKVHV
ncbi:zinc-ribbon domain-containing protein [Desulfonatronum thioautotrophicum]|uniref:zinc-ribbon domain-containing protein n=1 Tax=Desulfonatronum thioautotrophicum TaxID=617001 RepID=UPI0005EB51C4|nr:zinc-ribbon domain-containing protein [Desulfonatronum thioautotrophicum]